MQCIITKKRLERSKKGSDIMLKVILLKNNGSSIDYKYQIDGLTDNEHTGLFTVYDDGHYELSQKDQSAFSSAWAHAVRVGLNALKSGIYEKETTVAWY